MISLKFDFGGCRRQYAFYVGNLCDFRDRDFVFPVYLWDLLSLPEKRFYNKQFNVVLGVLPIITAGIILAMQSNLVISLGMVGALSIVRFRTAVKEPKDLLFLFGQLA